LKIQLSAHYKQNDKSVEIQAYATNMLVTGLFIYEYLYEAQPKRLTKN